MEVLRQDRRISFKVKRVAPPREVAGVPQRLRGRHMLAGLEVVNLPRGLARRAGLTHGVLVVRVRRGPAARLGFRKGDVILQLNGRRVGSVAELRALLAQQPRVRSLMVWRRGGIIRMRFG
jgi:S1-C subfamily serine protease